MCCYAARANEQGQGLAPVTPSGLKNFPQYQNQKSTTIRAHFRAHSPGCVSTYLSGNSVQTNRATSLSPSTNASLGRTCYPGAITHCANTGQPDGSVTYAWREFGGFKRDRNALQNGRAQLAAYRRRAERRHLLEEPVCSAARRELCGLWGQRPPRQGGAGSQDRPGRCAVAGLTCTRGPVAGRVDANGVAAGKSGDSRNRIPLSIS